MTPRFPLRLAAALALAAVAARAAAAVPPADAAPLPEEQHVLVTSDHPDVAEKSYRRLLKARGIFEEWQRSHPGTALRFRVYARKDGVDLSKLVMFLLDPETGDRTPVPLAPDGGFDVPVVDGLREHDAVLRTNLPPGDLAWRFEVARPGLDLRHRVLGDLREQCELQLASDALARTILTPVGHALIAAGDDLCSSSITHWDEIAERPVFAVHLSWGEHRFSLMGDRLHLAGMPAVMAPLADGGYALRDRDWTVHAPDDGDWPDETAVDIVYTDDVAPAPAATSAAAQEAR
ncbi:MAG: hypothetical protein ACTHL8_01725 [Burkholderiaceae bacterium]